MLSSIAQFLRVSDSVTFSLSREPSGQIRVLIQSILGPDPEHLDDEAKQLRAALAKPLIVRATEAELDSVLPQLAAHAASARNTVAVAYESYAADLLAVACAAKKSAETRAKSASKGSSTAVESSTAPKPPAASKPAATTQPAASSDVAASSGISGEKPVDLFEV